MAFLRDISLFIFGELFLGTCACVCLTLRLLRQDLRDSNSRIRHLEQEVEEHALAKSEQKKLENEVFRLLVDLGKSESRIQCLEQKVENQTYQQEKKSQEVLQLRADLLCLESRFQHLENEPVTPTKEKHHHRLHDLRRKQGVRVALHQNYAVETKSQASVDELEDEVEYIYEEGSIIFKDEKTLVTSGFSNPRWELLKF